MPENSNNNQTISYPGENFKDMIEAGVFYGRKRSNIHPKMKPFILTTRDNVGVINLSKTSEEMDAASNFIKEIIRKNGLPLFVGTQPSAQSGILKLADKFSFPYVINRWVGGTLTNFKVITKRVEYFKKTRNDLKSGVLGKYTKKERTLIEEETKRLEKLMGGLENLTRQPDVLVIIDPEIHQTAVREARRLKIPIISLINLDGDPDTVDYPVVGNNRAKKSIDWFLSKIELAIETGIGTRSIAVEKKTEEIKQE